MIITKYKLELYDKYYYLADGPPGLSDEAQNLIKRVFEDGDWKFINDVLYDLYLINQGLAAESFIQKARKTIKRECDCEATENFLAVLSSKYHPDPNKKKS